MNFRRGHVRDEVEINFIPLIDVLLVILIFLMVTTTYSRFAELQINLPQADANAPQDKPAQINIAVDAEGKYVINKTPISYQGPQAFADELKRAAGSNDDPVIVISADQKANYQSVISVMEAARLAGYGRLTFTTQSTRK